MPDKQQPQKVKHKIVYKGLAFILLPLILQIVSFYMLYQLAQRAESLAEAEAHQVKAVFWMDSVATEFANALGVTGTCLYGGNIDARAAAEEYRARVRPLVQQGRDVFAGNEHMLDIVADAEQLEDQQYHALKAISGMHLDKNNITGLISGVVAMKPIMMRLGGSVGKINTQLAVQRIELENARQAEQANRNQIKTQVLLGVAADVVLTVALLIIFAGSITKRLQALVDNAQKLPKGEALQSTVAGDDEIGYLDTVLHQAAQDLSDAAQNRKQIMEMVAHDLRSPITSAGIILERLMQRMKGQSGSGDFEDLKNTKNSLATVVSLVEDLLTIDKLDSGTLTLQKDLVEIRPLIQQSFGMVAGQSEIKQVKLVNEANEVALEGDKQRLLQVLNNLLSNAIKFSPEGATVRVTTEVAPSEIKFAVIDQGPGIPESEQSRVFDRFYQDGRSRGGFGLGLAITKSIVAAHSGRIGVTSVPPNGSKFWFALPVDVDQTDCEASIESL